MSAAAFCCRACGSADLHLMLSLGRTPLANALLTAEQLSAPEPVYPLDVVFCAGCALVQIMETVPPAALFSDYLYFSSFSDTMLAHAEALADELTQARGLDSAALVVEIASNDGYLLQFYKARGVPVLGIEPAANIARVAEAERGIPTLCEFFSAAVGERLRAEGRQADVVHAHNVLAHVADLNGVVQGIAALLKPGGVAIIEAPYIKDLIDQREFDTIYHEHLCYFSLTALDRLFARHGLVIADVRRVPIHGGSLQIRALRAGSAARGAAVQALLAEEAAWGVDDFAFYAGFARAVAALRADLRALLGGLKAQGKTIAAYGASAKGSTLLNYTGIGAETLDFVADRSTYKQGRYTPGAHLPIVAPAYLLAAQPDYVLLLTWNFAAEILDQQAEYRRRGGQFIIPIPQVRVV